MSIVITLVIGIVSGYLIGKYRERFRWNILIRKGIILKPGSTHFDNYNATVK